jgi:hypothetical protein
MAFSTVIRDISKYDDPPFRYESIPYETYDALIIRVHDGTSEDPRFIKHRDDCISSGRPWIPYSFYDWFYPAGNQVEETLAILDNMPGNAPLMFDVEKWAKFNYPPRPNLLAGMKELKDTYYLRINRLPLFYLNVDCINYLKPIPDWLRLCPLVLAEWGSEAHTCFPWPSWTLHQYQEDPDLNHFNGTNEAFYNWLSIPPNPPPPPPLPDKIIINANTLNIRSVPDARYSNNVIGSTKLNKEWQPIGLVTGPDLDGTIRDWWQINKYAYIAKWLTKTP